jgi:hypothetical protein
MSDETQVFETVDDNASLQDNDQATIDNQEHSQEGLEEAHEQQADEQGEKQKDPWYKRRIDELTRDKHEARRQAERLEKILEQQEQMLRQQQPQQQPQQSTLQPPNPADFAGGQYDPRYMDAMLQYTRSSAVEEAKQAIAAEYQQRAQQEAIMAAQARLETAEAAARAKYSDYDAVIEGVTSDPKLSQNETIKAALLGLDNGPDVAYILGRNLDVAYEIANIRNPIAAGMKLAELMNRAPRKVANAPNPIKPINGAAGGVAGAGRSYSEMSTAEFIAARNAEEMAKRQALYKR